MAPHWYTTNWFCCDIFSWPNTGLWQSKLHSSHKTPISYHPISATGWRLNPTWTGHTDMQVPAFKALASKFPSPFFPLTYHSSFLTPLPWLSLAFSSYPSAFRVELRPPFQPRIYKRQQLSQDPSYFPSSTLFWALISRGKVSCEL